MQPADCPGKSAEYVTVARSVKQLFHEYNIHCTTIQPEFEDDEGLEPDTCMYDCGPNRNCQQDTCCPQPASSTSSGNNHNHGSNSSHTSLAINNITYQSSGNALDTMLTTDTAYKSEANGKPSEQKQELNRYIAVAATLAVASRLMYSGPPQSTSDRVCI
ncbi:unnamed protein product [Dibothriocephalus latus]|uniref:Uncharacterized protein n=1 Tax=Dibothriocephalus latus TaxID=60516 RepID=A0A3P6VDY0_DIBLA|nr:unnamed protein product [Dibothriocephalus latus]